MRNRRPLSSCPKEVSTSYPLPNHKLTCRYFHSCVVGRGRASSQAWCRRGCRHRRPRCGRAGHVRFRQSIKGSDAISTTALVDELKPVLEQYSNATVKLVALDSSSQPDDGSSDRRQLRKNIKKIGYHRPTVDYEERLGKQIKEALGSYSTLGGRAESIEVSRNVPVVQHMQTFTCVYQCCDFVTCWGQEPLTILLTSGTRRDECNTNTCRRVFADTQATPRPPRTSCAIFRRTFINPILYAAPHRD